MVISVIICSHNPRPAYLASTIAALRSQDLDLAAWELVVVDNASVPPVAGMIDISWHPNGRIVEEAELGLTPARLCGIRQAAGEVLVFVDDDNMVDPDYLTCARSIAASHPFLGAWSGSVNGEFDEPPPDWTRRYWTSLVIRQVTRDAWSNLYFDDRTTPLGAGLCVRSQVAAEYLRLHDSGLRSHKLDRSGTSLVSGGDNDLAACAVDLGFGCGVLASLRLTHRIPAERLTEDYLLRLIEDISYSSKILRSFRSETSQGTAPGGPAESALDLVRMARMSPRERRFHRAVRRGHARAAAELGR